MIDYDPAEDFADAVHETEPPAPVKATPGAGTETEAPPVDTLDSQTEADNAALDLLDVYSPLDEVLDDIDEGEKVPTGRMLSLILEATFFPYRDPESRDVYVVHRHTRERVTGGVLHPLMTSEIVQHLAANFKALTDGDIASEQALRSALTAFAGDARLLKREPALRVGKGSDGAIWIDIGRDDERTVRVTAEGWTVEKTPGCYFRRTRGVGELPIPETGGSLDLLWPMVTVSEKDRPLVRAWIVQSMIPGMTPCPALFLHGEQGSAKSTSGQMIGSSALDKPTRTRPPRADTMKDFMVTSAGRWQVMIDNITSVSVDVSDALCRVVTGDTYSARKLHTDGDVFELSIRRPMIWTGISYAFLRGDLGERAIAVELIPMDEEDRRPEYEVWGEYKKMHGKIMGGTLDDLVYVLSTEIPKPGRLPRMADFALTALKLDAKYGTRSLPRWAATSAQISADSVESDPVWVAMARKIKEEWTGTSQELLDTLDPGDIERNRSTGSWPKNAKQLTWRLGDAMKTLKDSGWGVEQLDAAGTNRARQWKLTPPLSDPAKKSKSGSAGDQGRDIDF